MGLFLGVDVGTTSVSVVLVDCERHAVSGRSVPHGAGRAGAVAGRAELDLNLLWGVVLTAVREVVGKVARSGEVSALGVTGQMHGLALVGPDGTPAAPAITWQDQRATERDETGVTYLEGFIREAGGPAAFGRMGASPATGYLGPSLYWLRRQGLLPRSPVTACLIPDAIVARLTGGPPATDPTDAASSGLYDVVSGAWDLAVLRGVRVSERLLAPVRASGEVAGRLRRDVAQRMGLAAGLPVAAALGDNQASFIGSVRDAGRSLLINVGTGAQVSALVNGFAREPGLEARPFPGGRFLLVGAGLYGGASYALLRDFYGQIGRAFFGAEGDEGLYDRMNALAADVSPGSDGLRCVPLFAGTRVDPTVRGCFAGVTPHNLTPGHLARALLEGVAEQLGALWEAMRPLAGARDELVGAGNAIARNALLARILAARFGLALNLPAFDEPAAVGAALVAATAAGAFPTIDAAMREMVRYRATVDPEPWGRV